MGSAVKAVAAGALPAERFKFFYKSVELLPPNPNPNPGPSPNPSPDPKP